jgi:hypothetical protein
VEVKFLDKEVLSFLPLLLSLIIFSDKVYLVELDNHQEVYLDNQLLFLMVQTLFLESQLVIKRKKMKKMKMRKTGVEMMKMLGREVEVHHLMQLKQPLIRNQLILRSKVDPQRRVHMKKSIM